MTQPNFAAETNYIAQRRKQVGVSSSAPVTALCFCGGGLRSGTLSLGILQGLEESDLLRRADYLSSASGGAYMASWYVSHLLPRNADTVYDKKSLFLDEHPSYQSERAGLLQTKPSAQAEKHGPVTRLQNHRGFFFGIGNYRLFSEFPLRYGWRLPVAAVMDLGLHFKPYRGKANWYHNSVYYEDAIRRAYLYPPDKLIHGQTRQEGFFKDKQHPVRLDEINAPGSQSPYLIVNAALANKIPDDRSKLGELLPFEFTRFSVGAPVLGYVPANHFGFPVVGEREKDGAHRQTVHRSNPISFLPFLKTKPIPLANAVSASGAAVDAALFAESKNPVQRSISVEGRKVPVVQSNWLTWDMLLKLFNANLRYHNRNFAMKVSESPKYPMSLADGLLDRRREVMEDRFVPTLNSNSLYISDGGHYDNLSVLAVLERPEVQEIWSFDTGCDGAYKFSDFKRLQALVKAAGWRGIEHLKMSHKELLDEKPSAHLTKNWSSSPVFHATLTKGTRKVSFWYVKSSYRVGDGIPRGQNQNTLALDGAARGRTTQNYLAEYRSGQHTRFSQSTPSKFPHTSTGNLSFTQNDFDAYREMGRVLAHHLAVKRKAQGTR